MKKTPLVSISCITYNHASYIRDALEGFVNQQTDFGFEVLIHDDCSPDGTADIIREYAERYPDIIRPMYETENQYSQGKPIGTQVWNLPRARGKYIAICEGDDYWTDPQKLQKQVDFLEKNPGYGMCYGRVRQYSERDGKFIEDFGGKSEEFKDLVIANTIPTCTVMVRKELIDKYVEDKDCHSWKQMGDYPMWLYFAANSKIKFIEEILGVYRIIDGSASHPKSIDKWLNFQKAYADIKIHYIKRFCREEDLQLLDAVDYVYMKSVLRQRTLYNKSLKKEADHAIETLKCGYLKKKIFHVANNSTVANFFLKIHLKNNNRRNNSHNH